MLRHFRGVRRERASQRVPTAAGRFGALEAWLDAQADWVSQWVWPRGTGVAVSILIMLGGYGYGMIRGERVPASVAYLKDIRDNTANAAGFRIDSIALSGEKHLSRETILASAGVTEHTSLLFLDVASARRQLKANPWIADATVAKLYPDRLQITIAERKPFALWQHDRHVNVVAADGTVLEPYVAGRFSSLPFVVGKGAQTRAKDFLALLDRYPILRDEVRASVLVAERRWNLFLKNGLDVRLPETGVAHALDLLASLDRDKQILSRDITSIDLRLADRVTVHLSDEAARAREEALKEKAKQRKGGSV